MYQQIAEKFCVDIETEWNLKVFIGRYGRYGKGRRYRNRVEFKGRRRSGRAAGGRVDIETEWNLKCRNRAVRGISIIVDIETEWNLKQFGQNL